MLLYLLLNFMYRYAHFNAQGFGFFRARHHAAVVVRQHHHGRMAQIGPEQLFTAGVEVVAVHQGEYRHWRRFLTTLVTTPKTSSTIPSSITNGGYEIGRASCRERVWITGVE